MALRDRTRSDTDDTVAGSGTTSRPARVDDHHDERPVVVRKGSVGSTIKTVVATVLLVGLVLVALANTDDVRVDLLLETYSVSLALLVGLAALTGLLIGLLLGARRKHRSA